MDKVRVCVQALDDTGIYSGTIVSNLQQQVVILAARVSARRLRAGYQLNPMDDCVFHQRLEEHTRQLQVMEVRIDPGTRE